MDVQTYALIKTYMGNHFVDFLNSETGQAMIREAIEDIVGEIVTTSEMNSAIQTAIQDVLTT